jgi:hypothetical protein
MDGPALPEVTQYDSTTFIPFRLSVARAAEGVMRRRDHRVRDISQYKAPPGTSIAATALIDRSLSRNTTAASAPAGGQLSR